MEHATTVLFEKHGESLLQPERFLETGRFVLSFRRINVSAESGFNLFVGEAKQHGSDAGEAVSFFPHRNERDWFCRIRITSEVSHLSHLQFQPASDPRDQFFPALSVSPKGLVGVSWLDRRNDPNNIDYQAFAAISTDGGRTFPNTQLTQAFSNPDNNGTGNNWMGDYTGNTWAGSDFIAAWMDSSNGVDMQEVVGGVRLK